jgi:hypothetical protein
MSKYYPADLTDEADRWIQNCNRLQSCKPSAASIVSVRTEHSAKVFFASDFRWSRSEVALINGRSTIDSLMKTQAETKIEKLCGQEPSKYRCRVAERSSKAVLKIVRSSARVCEGCQPAVRKEHPEVLQIEANWRQRHWRSKHYSERYHTVIQRVKIFWRKSRVEGEEVRGILDESAERTNQLVHRISEIGIF